MPTPTPSSPTARALEATLAERDRLRAEKAALVGALQHAEACLSAARDAIGRPVPRVWTEAQAEARAALQAAGEEV